MANSDKINSLNLHAPLSTTNKMNADIDDVLRQFDSLNTCASVGTYNRYSKCDFSCSCCILCRQ